MWFKSKKTEEINQKVYLLEKKIDVIVTLLHSAKYTWLDENDLRAISINLQELKGKQ